MVEKAREEYFSACCLSCWVGDCPLHRGMLKPRIGMYGSIFWVTEN